MVDLFNILDSLKTVSWDKIINALALFQVPQRKIGWFRRWRAPLSRRQRWWSFIAKDIGAPCTESGFHLRITFLGLLARSVLGAPDSFVVISDRNDRHFDRDAPRWSCQLGRWRMEFLMDDPKMTALTIREMPVGAGRWKHPKGNTLDF